MKKRTMIRAAALGLALTTILSGCTPIQAVTKESESAHTEQPVIFSAGQGKEPATMSWTADYLVNAADDYNKTDRSMLLDGLEGGVEQMIQGFIDNYKKRIKELDWMGEETKQNAIEKLNHMRFFVGYPE